MRKFIKDMAEIFKDPWAAFVWVVQAADEIGDRIDGRMNKNKPVTSKVTYATTQVKRSCVMTQD